MKLSQIIIIEDVELDFSGLDPSIVEKLKDFKPHYQQWAIGQVKDGVNINNVIDSINYYDSKIGDNRFQEIIKKFSPHPKNILTLSSEQIHDALAEFEKKYPSVSKREMKKRLKKGAVEDNKNLNILVDDGKLKIIKITAADDIEEASRLAAGLASNTQWCVLNPNIAHSYLAKDDLYFIFIDGEKKYLCHVESAQFRDIDDKPVKLDDDLYDLISPFIPKVGRFYHDQNSDIYRDAIIDSPKLAFQYAIYVLHDRWPEAEPFIAKNPEYALDYAREVIEGRWPAAEPTIAKNPEYAYVYALDIINGRWPEAEPFIAQDAGWAYEYAKDIIHHRWPEGEPAIATMPYYAYHYALDVIEGRWPEAENVIANSAIALDYAKHIIRGRWPQAEPYLSQDPYYFKQYKEFIGKKP